VCKEDPGAADACKVVTKFIQGKGYVGDLRGFSTKHGHEHAH
jgi:hypothetical protein